MNATIAAQNLRAAAGWIVILFSTSILRAAQPVDPVRTLLNQDAAFSLLLEAFREVQGSMIRNDYQARLQAADRLRDPQKRQAVVWMSDLERHLRQQKLAVQVERLQTTYAYARRNDERTAGIDVPSAVNLNAAATALREFVVVAPDGLEPPTFDDQSPTLCAARPSPRQFKAHLELLRQYMPALSDAVTGLLSSARELPGGAPTLLLVSWRVQDGVPSHVVVQVFGELPAAATEPVRRNHRRCDNGDLFLPVENWLRLLTVGSMTWFGAADDVRQRQRVFAQLQEGDATFLREQTVEPLSVVAVLPEPSAFLPSCLRARVRSLIVAGELSLQQWHGEVRLLSETEAAAQQVSAVMTSWRAMAQPVADIYVAGDRHQDLRLALDACQIKASGTVTIVEGRSASGLCHRAVVKLMRWATEAEP